MFLRKKKVGPEYYFERGEECLKKGNYQWAVESFTKAIEFDPTLEMAYYRRAETYKKLGNNRDAVLDYIRFLEVDHRQPDMVEDLSGTLKEAVKIARRGWEKDRAKEEIKSFGISNLLEELIEFYDPPGKYSDKRFYQIALSWLRENSKRDPLSIGFLQLLIGKYDEAIEEFDKSIAEGTEDPDVYYFRGMALLRKKKIAEGKRGILKRGESKERLSEQIQESFEQALKKRYRWRLCPKCGYRASTETNFCAYCGVILMSAD